MSVDGVHLLHCKPRFSFSLVKGTDNCFSRNLPWWFLECQEHFRKVLDGKVLSEKCERAV